jgi:hypothetical protein
MSRAAASGVLALAPGAPVSRRYRLAAGTETLTGVFLPILRLYGLRGLYLPIRLLKVIVALQWSGPDASSARPCVMVIGSRR